MNQVNNAAFYFASAVFGITISMYAAHAPSSTAVFLSIVFTLACSSASSFLFMKSALLYLREGKPQLDGQASQPQGELLASVDAQVNKSE